MLRDHGPLAGVDAKDGIDSRYRFAAAYREVAEDERLSLWSSSTIRRRAGGVVWFRQARGVWRSAAGSMAV